MQGLQEAQRRRRASGFAVLLGGLALLGVSAGCALDPYVEVPVPTVDPAKQTVDGQEVIKPADVDYSAFPSLKTARQRTGEILTNVEDYRSDYAMADIALDLLTFGAAAAGGVAAVYGAGSNLVLGLGLTATGAYTANSIFVSQDRIALYMSAVRGLHCVINADDRVAATAKALGAEIDGSSNQKLYDDLWAALLVVEENPAAIDKALLETAYNALASYEAAKLNFETFKAQDVAFAQITNQTAGLIIDELNKRLAAIAPTPDQLFKLASGIGGIAGGFVKQVTPQAPPTPSDEAPPRVLTEAEKQQRVNLARARVKELTPKVQQTADSINSRIAAATNLQAELATTCVLEQPQPAPLKLKGSNAVTLAKDQATVLTFEDGRPELSTTWKESPAPDVEAIAVGHTVTLWQKSSAKPGIYTLLVRDSLAAPSEIAVKVTVK